jgi:hypothetical protein
VLHLFSEQFKLLLACEQPYKFLWIIFIWFENSYGLFSFENLFVHHSFIHSCIHAFIHSCIHSFVAYDKYHTQVVAPIA